MTLLIGQTLAESPAPIGFVPTSATLPCAQADIIDSGDAGLVTIAGTGAGKGVSQVIPNLLVYPGSAVVIDVKGEIAAVTARRRREMGQDVFIIDPFRTSRTDFLDPFDLIRSRHPSAVDRCRMLATMIGGQASHLTDPFWDDRARDIVTGTLLFLAEHVPDHLRSLPLAQRFWTSDITRIADGMALMRASPLHDGILGRFASQFIDPADKTRASIHSSIQNMLEPLASILGQRGFGVGARGRKVDLGAFVAGRPMTIYLTVPPAYLVSHAALLRIWVGTLLAALQERRSIPAVPTLFLVDEAAQLGKLDMLLTAATLMRGYGLRVWTFWQSIAQMERLYGPACREIIDNAGTISVFGLTNGSSAEAAMKLTGWTGPLLGQPRETQLIVRAGHPAELVRRIDYRSDPRFAGLFDPNPFHAAPAPAPEICR